MEHGLLQLRKEILNCWRCEAIVQTRNKPIIGVGSPKAKIIIVGLAPGKDGADLTGIPFTRDPSGELTEEMLSVAGLSREQDVFITNLVKCNPKDSEGRNRSPTKDEIKNCFPYLRREIDLIKPRIIVTLGKAATEFLSNAKTVNMVQFHGKIRSQKGILFFPFIHPGYVVRGAYDKKKYLEEFKVLGDIFRNLIKEESRLSRLDILLLLLRKSSDGGSEGLIRGKTKLQKLLFLVQNELKNRGFKAKYAFRPYLYGPYSRELYTDIEWLRMNELIEVRTTFDDDIGLMTDFAITEKGRRKLSSLMDSQIYGNIDEIINSIVSKYGEMDVAQLVEFVHKRFVDYDRSRLKEKDQNVNIKLDHFMDLGSKTSTSRAQASRREI